MSCPQIYCRSVQQWRFWANFQFRSDAFWVLQLSFLSTVAVGFAFWWGVLDGACFERLGVSLSVGWQYSTSLRDGFHPDDSWDWYLENCSVILRIIIFEVLIRGFSFHWLNWDWIMTFRHQQLMSPAEIIDDSATDDNHSRLTISFRETVAHYDGHLRLLNKKNCRRTRQGFFKSWTNSRHVYIYSPDRSQKT
jgi:hypothetical protein